MFLWKVPNLAGLVSHPNIHQPLWPFKNRPWFGSWIISSWTWELYYVYFCQTPIPGQTWELTLLSRGQNKNKKKPHLNSPRRGCARGLKFCMRLSVTKRIRLHPEQNFWYLPLWPTMIYNILQFQMERIKKKHHPIFFTLNPTPFILQS